VPAILELSGSVVAVFLRRGSPSPAREPRPEPALLPRRQLLEVQRGQLGFLRQAALLEGTARALEFFPRLRDLQTVSRCRGQLGLETAHYEIVSTETTGHAEAVEITFDPHRISYGQILQLYFAIAHDPTELNRQGPDSGPSYRSEIFFNSPTQERIARAYVAQLTKAKVFGKPIVTKVEALNGFYPAEDYHQDFLIRHPTYPYIVRNDLPKIAALKRVYPERYRPTPVTLAGAR
jgi:methionine-S-sulfoxide reductase